MNHHTRVCILIIGTVVIILGAIPLLIVSFMPESPIYGEISESGQLVEIGCILSIVGICALWAALDS